MSGSGTVTLTTPAPHVALVTIDNPDRLGALSPDMLEQLSASWRTIAADHTVRAIVLTGVGRGFSTGLDLAAASDGDDPQSRYSDEDERPHLGLSPLEFDIWLPLIVAVNGVCAGGGFHLLADADVILCAPDATFLDPHAAVGQVSALEPIALARRIPLQAVLRMVVLGREGSMTADDAHRVGLVSEVVPDDRLVDRAVTLAEAAAANSPATIERSKRAIHDSLAMPLHHALDHGWQAVQAHWDHPDYHEGIAAYVERRSPVWDISHDRSRTSDSVQPSRSRS